MSRSAAYVLLLVLLAAPSFGLTATAAIDIEGFQLEPGEAKDSQIQHAMASLRRQINIVVSVDLPPKVLAFMRRVPIVLSSSASNVGGEYKRLDGRWVATLPFDPIPDNRPVLLHELLHAYHHQILGAAPEILASYGLALQSEWPADYAHAHFLDNHLEYFAVIASIYLFGRIQQPPYDCDSISREQPPFMQFLSVQFGDRKCGAWQPSQHR